MATISDVAKRANVSKATVSRVMNGISVREDSRTRVLEAIKELEFRPNAQARSLTSGRTNVVGVLVPAIDAPFYGPILGGIQETLFQYNFNMMVCSTYHQRGSEWTFSKLLWEKRVDGLLIVTPREITHPAMRTLLLETAGNHFPVVVADGELAEADISGVWVANYLGGYKAVQYLLQLGHRKIGLLLGVKGAREAQQRQLGYERAMYEAGIEIDTRWIVTAGDYEISSGLAAAPQLLAQDVTAIFATSDGLAWAVMEKAKEEGLTIPEELSVIGYDDEYFSALVSPKLTTIKQPLRALGETAARKLVKTILGEEKETSQTILPVEVIVRESTAPPKPLARSLAGRR